MQKQFVLIMALLMALSGVFWIGNASASMNNWDKAYEHWSPDKLPFAAIRDAPSDLPYHTIITIYDKDGNYSSARLYATERKPTFKDEEDFDHHYDLYTLNNHGTKYIYDINPANPGWYDGPGTDPGVTVIWINAKLTQADGPRQILSYTNYDVADQNGNVVYRWTGADVIPTINVVYPFSGIITISRQQLEANNYVKLALLSVEGAAMFRMAKDVPGRDYVDWDLDEVYYKEGIPPASETLIDLTATFKALKDELTVGTHRFYLVAFSQKDFDDPNVVEPTVKSYIDVKVVDTNSQLPPLNPDDDGLPEMPKPPDDNWDVVGWLKYLLDWVLYIFQIFAYVLRRIGTAISEGFGAVTGLTGALTAYFSWLPPEVVTLIIMGVCAAIITAIVKR